jgi:hypothetical protein
MLSQAEVEEEMQRLAGLCEKVTHEITRRGVAAAEADAAYRLAQAEAYLVAEGTVAEREAHSVVATQQAYRDRRIAEARLEGAKEAGRNYRAQLETLRSINSNLRALVVGS